jgi:hypothetical protein
MTFGRDWARRAIQTTWRLLAVASEAPNQICSNQVAIEA